jgi:hypothetical protein
MFLFLYSQVLGFKGEKYLRFVNMHFTTRDDWRKGCYLARMKYDCFSFTKIIELMHDDFSVYLKAEMKVVLYDELIQVVLPH